MACKRLSKSGGAKPQLLLVTLPSDDDAITIVRSVRSLRSSNDVYVAANVFVNRDLTADQRKEQFDLRSELSRRLASSESNLTICNGSIQKRSSRTPTAGPPPQPALHP